MSKWQRAAAVAAALQVPLTQGALTKPEAVGISVSDSSTGTTALVAYLQARCSLETC